MPLFDKKDKSRYATFTRRSLGLGGGMTRGVRGAGGPALSAADPRRRPVQGRGRRQPRHRAADRAAARPHPGPLRRRAGQQPAQLSRAAGREQATEGVEAALDTIGKVILLTDQQKKRVLHDIAMNKKFVPVPVAENLTWEEFSRINLHLPYLPGVQPDVGETRDYPFGKELVAYPGLCRRGLAGGHEATTTIRCSSLPGYSHRQARHREGSSTSEVRGQAGASRVEVNAYGRVIRELGKEPGVPGEDVWLTIDREVQQFADQRLGDESAACVRDGCDRLATCSRCPPRPASIPTGSMSASPARQWRDADHRRSQAAAQQGASAASIRRARPSRPAVALAAVEAGIATPDYRVNCNGVDSASATTPSIAGRTRRPRPLRSGRRHQEFLRRLLLRDGAAAGHRQDRGGGAQAGPGRAHRHRNAGRAFRPHPSARLEAEDATSIAWQQGETLSAGIGQGYVTATPLQLCQQAARIASGKAVTPRLVHSVGGKLLPRPDAAQAGFLRRGAGAGCATA